MAVTSSAKRATPSEARIRGEVAETRAAAPHVSPTSADTSHRKITVHLAGISVVMATPPGRSGSRS
jgi:hypothetical protein